jgi:hypothetical protein
MPVPKLVKNGFYSSLRAWGGILHSLHARVFFEAISLWEFKNGARAQHYI